ncbi:arrestin domain protein [Ancylostoma ceylanicum]|uniref:Arrestin domain protein n=1 Tax=Ancylostoma ceylanicum TaxID=53326 RepID=A0A0D6LUH8_9BILA|nr:arrestin domain protein [Ancylostoma ceylanicum]
MATIEQQEDLLDLSIGAEEDIWNLALAPVENSEAVTQSTPKRNRVGKKERVKRKPEDVVEGEPSAKVAPSTEITAAPKPKMTLRPLLLSQDSKGFISSKDVVDMFYSILDVVNKSDARQNRIEDTLRIMRSKMDGIDKRILRLENAFATMAQQQTPSTGCPAVPATKYCEICYVEGHQASQCRSKKKMDPEHCRRRRMSNDRFYITLSNEDEVYAPGSDIEGVAHIILEEATKAQFLKISLDARARTEWKQSIGSGKSMSTKFYSAKVIYADEEVVAWSSPPGTTEVLPVGSHHYPFTLKLPPDLPPSFEGKYGYVRYMVKMELDRPWYRSNKKTTKAFTDELFILVPAMDLYNVSQAMLPAKKLKAKKLGIALFRHEDVTLECETHKGGFVPGEVIVVNARVINGSSKDIVKARAELIEISTYVGNSCSLTFGPTLTFIGEGSENKRRQQRRRLAAGEQVKFESSGSLNRRIEASIPIVIGTIPVLGTVIRDNVGPPSLSCSSQTEIQSVPSRSGDGDGEQ